MRNEQSSITKGRQIVAEALLVLHPVRLARDDDISLPAG